MKNSTILHEISPEQMSSWVNEILKQLALIKGIKEPKVPSELLTRAEVAELLKVDLSTLWNWQKKGKLIPVGLAGRVYYRRSDIESVLTPLGVIKKGEKNV